MPTTLSLDPDDRIGSIRSRLEAVSDRVVTLMVPPGNRALQNPVNLRLLRRHLDRLAIHAILLTKDEKTRKLAQAEGLRVRLGGTPEPSTTGHIQGSQRWPLSAALGDTFTPVSSWGAGRVLGLVGVVIALGVLLAGVLVFSPSATITVELATRPVEEALLITASSLNSRPNAARLQVPAKVMDVEFQASAQAPTEGIREGTGESARGEVTLVNSSPIAVEVLSGTRVGTASGVVFQTVGSASVPQDRPSGVPVAVVAAKPGAEGNVPAGSVRQMLDPLLSRWLVVSNGQPMIGGTASKVKIVAEEDRQRLKELVLTQATEQVKRKIGEMREPELSFFQDSIRWRTVKEELTPQIGQEATEASLAMQGTAHIVGFLGRDVNAVLRQHYEQKEPGFSFVQGSLKTRVLERVRSDSDVVEFHVQASAVLRERLDEGQMKALVRGKTPREAEAALAELLGLGKPPHVTTAPFWVGKVPDFTWRILIREAPSR